MSTLIFCTSYADTSAAWEDRYRFWVTSIMATGLNFNSVLIVDDGSPLLPSWQDTSISFIGTDDVSPSGGLRRSVNLHHFSHRLGRNLANIHFPGWYRSFGHAANHAFQNGFEKLIYVESDAQIIGRPIVDYINAFEAGWMSPWCPSHSFPEMAIQCISGKSLADCVRFFKRPYSDLTGRSHEFALPFTHIEKSFVGDRYGEYSHTVPRGVDFCSQLLAGMSTPYYWWINEKTFRGLRRVLIVIQFGKEGYASSFMLSGWSTPEDRAVWTEGVESSLMLPPMDAPHGGIFALECQPFDPGMGQPVQKVALEINGMNCGQATVVMKGVVELRFGGGTVFQGKPNRIRLIHTDAASPRSFGESDDERLLSLYVIRLVIRAEPNPDTKLVLRLPASSKSRVRSARRRTAVEKLA